MVQMSADKAMRFGKKVITCLLGITMLFFPTLIFAQTPLEEAQRFRDEGYQAQIRGDLDRALSLYRSAVGISPRYVTAYNDLGIIYEAKGYIEEAERYYLKAIEIDPAYLAAYTNLAFLYEKKGELQRAKSFWRKRILLGGPDDPWTKRAKEALSKYPEETQILQEKKASELIDLISETLEDKRNEQKLRLSRAKRHFVLGLKRYKLGQYKQALEELRIAMALDPQDEKVQQLYNKVLMKERQAKIKKYSEEGLELFEEGRDSAAMRKFERILSLIPANPTQESP